MSERSSAMEWRAEEGAGAQESVPPVVWISEQDPEERHSSGTAFMLWLACFLGACGIHRFYLGKPMSGLLYLLTFGLLGIGQVVDLFLIREMVLRANARKLMSRPARRLLPAPGQATDPTEELRMKLMRAAAANGGKLSVPQGVMATGKPLQTVEKLLDEMAVSGHVDIGNDEETGTVIYIFGGLA